MEQTIADFIDKYGIGLYIPSVHITDIIEVLILTFLIYQIILWIKNYARNDALSSFAVTTVQSEPTFTVTSEGTK